MTLINKLKAVRPSASWGDLTSEDQRELVEGYIRMAEALERLHKAAKSVTPFITSKQRIQSAAGEQWWAEELYAAAKALNPEPKP